MILEVFSPPRWEKTLKLRDLLSVKDALEKKAKGVTLQFFLKLQKDQKIQVFRCTKGSLKKFRV